MTTIRICYVKNDTYGNRMDIDSIDVEFDSTVESVGDLSDMYSKLRKVLLKEGSSLPISKDV